MESPSPETLVLLASALSAAVMAGPYFFGPASLKLCVWQILSGLFQLSMRQQLGGGGWGEDRVANLLVLLSFPLATSRNF